MTHAYWQRFLAAGEELATQPDLFPGVVAFLEAMVDGDGSREFILRFHESQIAHLTPGQIAELLCHAEPRLAELEDKLDIAVKRLSIAERQVAARWALYAMRGHDETLPSCVSQLLAMLHNPPETP